MDELQDSARRFIKELARKTGWSLTRLAHEGGMSHSTLTRFVNKEDVKTTISLRTLDNIRTAAAEVIPVEQIDNLWLMLQRRPPPPPNRPRVNT